MQLLSKKIVIIGNVQLSYETELSICNNLLHEFYPHWKGSKKRQKIKNPLNRKHNFKDRIDPSPETKQLG